MEKPIAAIRKPFMVWSIVSQCLKLKIISADFAERISAEYINSRIITSKVFGSSILSFYPQIPGL